MTDSTPTITLHAGDNRDTLRRLIDQGVQVHSVVCDPPYGLVSTVKRFGKEGSAPAKSEGATGVFKRASGGFMNQQWDATGIERDPEFWRLIWEILLPGGYVLAFSSARTGHWQACAMETAGFIMHPFFGWAFGSGFPKAHNAAMAIDKALKVEGGRGEPKSAAHAGWIERGAMRGDEGNEGWQRDWMGDPEKVAANASKYLPGSPEAQQWEGWAYGAQSMKPAFEPIYFGQKPFSEKTGALNLLKHGVGAVNIDGCRVPTTEEGGRPLREVAAMRDDVEYNGNALAGRVDGSLQSSKAVGTTNTGRHPANLIHDGSDEVVAMFPHSNGQQGKLKGTEPSAKTDNVYGEFAGRAPSEPRNDSGSAARFFNSFPFEADPLFYHPKANKNDRAGSKHPTVKPVALMQHLVRLVTPPGGTVLDPFGGSGTTGEAARREGFNCILMEADETYVADIRKRFGLPAPADDGFDDIFDDVADEFDSMFG